MAQIQADILAQIKRYDTIIIHRHQRPDPDAYGSQLGLQAILKASFPDKKIYAAGKEIPGLSWIGDGKPIADEVPDSAYKKALVIVVDTANDPRVDDQRWRNGMEVVKIDHHPNVEPYGDWQWVEDEAAATAVLIYKFYEMLKDEGLVMTAEAARYLYIGIIGDTGRFMYSLNQDVFDVAGKLVSYGFDYQTMYTQMTTLPEPAVKLSGWVMQNITVLDSGFAYVVLDRELLDSFHLGDAGTSYTVSIPSRIDRVKAWAIFEEQDNGDYRVRLRSRSIVINTIAQDFDGGGHPLASGAWAYGKEQIQEVIDRVDTALQNENK